MTSALKSAPTKLLVLCDRLLESRIEGDGLTDALHDEVVLRGAGADDRLEVGGGGVRSGDLAEQLEGAIVVLIEDLRQHTIIGRLVAKRHGGIGVASLADGEESSHSLVLGYLGCLTDERLSIADITVLERNQSLIECHLGCIYTGSGSGVGRLVEVGGCPIDVSGEVAEETEVIPGTVVLRVDAGGLLVGIELHGGVVGEGGGIEELVHGETTGTLAEVAEDVVIALADDGDIGYETRATELRQDDISKVGED